MIFLLLISIRSDCGIQALNIEMAFTNSLYLEGTDPSKAILPIYLHNKHL